jgi:large subunit ribosomal protein L19
MNIQQTIESINASVIKPSITHFDVGDTVNVDCKIVEGDKHRIQTFQGVVIGRFGRGITEMIQVRRIVDGVGVERRFPLNSPLVDAIEVVRRGDARRAKLYYLRDRKGKSQRLRDRRRGMKVVAGMKLAGQN